MRGRIAVYFRLHEGAVRVKQGPAWQADLVDRITTEVQPLGGLRQKRAHRALVTLVVKALVDEGAIINGGRQAVMPLVEQSRLRSAAVTTDGQARPTKVDRGHGRRSPRLWATAAA